MNQYHQEDIAQIVRNAVERYKRFMKIEMFPKYVLELVPADNALNSANEKGFGRIAIASYDVRNDQHYLTITEGIDPLDYLLFHELRIPVKINVTSCKTEQSDKTRGMLQFNCLQQL